jgi:AICAR transformylase/IMP cyclohydrolase PurH
MDEIALRYGTNPQQHPARAYAERLPIRVLGGQPGAINILDGRNRRGSKA